MWIDTHCHLDAPEFGPDHALGLQARESARALGVALCVYPAVERANFDAVRELAHRTGDAYALGIHPLYVPRALDSDLRALADELERRAGDPRLVAVGEIGLDFFVPELCTPAMRERQWQCYREQLRLAQRHGLPVILHGRRSVDWLLKGLREAAARGRPVAGGIAHAFNGSLQQAQVLLALGFKLGLGGAATFDAARQLRQLFATLPPDALVLETDAPDIPPQWCYVNAAERAAGRPQGLNSPAELPRIGAGLAGLRGLTPDALADLSTANALAALPRLTALLPLLAGAVSPVQTVRQVEGSSPASAASNPEP
ncbi:TatD family hydrolase [Malikia sp.]|uniref:TatD family hydrolase n=1 Tax=Malikia sp. TaxID=2070706 RepID=UPI0026210C48|nr:TatD family hydrolase [Malikia sp.]MDD2730325.1 TatD family hydrolase [Malikia sp.]